MKTLDGLQIIITRPEIQAQRWQARLQAQGAETYLLPVLDIVPIDDPKSLQAVTDVVAELEQFNKIIFVSQNAIQHAQRFINSLPAASKLFAVGRTTAELLAPWGGVVEAADKAMNSETLLALPALQSRQINGERILICRGVGGRTILGDTLRQRGARVEYCELYYRRRFPKAEDKLRQFLNEGRNPDRLQVVSSHSGDSLRFLQETINALGDAGKVLLNWPLVVPGERVAAIAKQQGFKRIICAENASDEMMSRALVDWQNQQGAT